ncbi:MAG: outer membrane protein assembly factor BamA [Deltaproteobacteria bacterium]|nr:outer membrane protein assembly factor BamA [Deltaproteobacteria bacterium]
MKPLILILFGFLLVMPTPLWGRESRIADIKIEGEASLPREEIEALLPLKRGDPLNEKELGPFLDYLKKWGRFSEIKMEKKTTPEGLLLILHLKEGMKVVDIQVSGNYPYLSKSLHRKLSVHRGDFYDPEIAQDQIKRLQDFYEREGYAGTTVTLDIQPDHKWENVILHYHIKKGDRYQLNQIEIEGNQLFPRGYFISQLNPLILYRPARLRNSLNKIRKDYQKKGYLEARVRIKQISIDEKKRKINLKLAVQEGPHVKVRFHGNKRLSRKTLKKVIPVLTEGDTSSLAIEESKQAIQALYKERGFLEASVVARKKRLDVSEILIQFDIQEGTQTRVKQVRLVGAKQLRPRKIKRHLTTEEESIFKDGYYNPETVEADFLRLPEIYHHHGFLEARALDKKTDFSPLGDKATISFFVEEGPEFRIKSISFEGNQIPSEKLNKILKMKNGDRLTQEELKIDESVLQNFYSDEGYTYTKIEPHLLQEDQKIHLVYKIQEGPQTKVGEILIVGNYRTRHSAIRKALALKPNRPFSLNRLLKSESSLRRMGVFQSVDIEPLGIQEHKEEIHLLVKVEENPRSYIDLESSYDTDNKFTGAISLQHNNLFGFAKRSTLRLTGGNDIQKGELNYIDPRFFGVNLEMVTTGLVEAEQRPSFEAIDYGGKLSFRSPLTNQITLLTKYDLTRTSFQNVADPTALATRDHTLSRIGFSFNFDSRDSFADPKKGINALTGLDVSNKILASGFNFLQPSASIAHYQFFASRFTLFNYLRAEGINVFGSDVLPRDKRLFLGGDYSVRGFDQDSISPRDATGQLAGGLILLLHTIEIQTKIKGGLKFASFLDSGSVTDNFSQLDLGSLRHSAGAGLRYITPIGPLRLDYGIKLDRNRAVGESFGRLHFAFGYAF